MKRNEYEAMIRKAFPGCQIEEDNDDQIIIYTNKMEITDGEIVDYVPSDEDK